ncbi:hypothetical protein DPMN_121152 [Dreissena polymorpha]|uniref:Uncharacterized protein n=1 Tax=Dreissena polymorpha TaxID=45954 RepID=A0A9D4GM87_DREPO|nr:hypothetical protein DPMN_121152 [Dreissena polymorpha]
MHTWRRSRQPTRGCSHSTWSGTRSSRCSSCSRISQSRRRPTCWSCCTGNLLDYTRYPWPELQMAWSCEVSPTRSRSARSLSGASGTAPRRRCSTFTSARTQITRDRPC